MKEQKNNDSKMPQPSPNPSSVDIFVHKPSKSSIQQLETNLVHHEKQKIKNDILAMLLGHKNMEILENID